MEREPYISTKDAASYLGLAKTTLDKCRHFGGGPKYYRFGGAIRYRLSDLDAWAESRTALSTSENAA